MIQVTEMYRGNEDVVRAESLQQGLQQGEQMTYIKLFLQGRLNFSDLAEGIGEKKALLVHQKSPELKQLLEKSIPLLVFQKNP